MSLRAVPAAFVALGAWAQIKAKVDGETVAIEELRFRFAGPIPGLLAIIGKNIGASAVGGAERAVGQTLDALKEPL